MKCSRCKQILPLDQFAKNRTTKSGYTSYCRPCHRLNGRESVARNGGARKYHIWKRYGLTEAEYEALLQKQRNKCAICRKPDPTHIDHDHKGKEEIGGKERVRGILCTACNNGLGLFRDDSRLLEQAAAYLQVDRLLNER